MLKRHPLIAVTFLLGGLLFAAGFWILSALGNMEGGMSAGAVPASPSVALPVIATEAYFVLGIVASLFPHILARRLLSLISHVAVIFAVFYLWHLWAPLVNIFSEAILIIAVIYGTSWLAMTRKHNVVA